MALDCSPEFFFTLAKLLTTVFNLSAGRCETSDEKKLLDAARCGDKDQIVSLINSRTINLNVAAEDGSSAVHYSSQAADLLILDLLLEHGARTDVFDNNGMAPIHFAAEKDHVDTLALLIAYKGEINLKNKKNGKTALHYACKLKKRPVINFLLCCGSDFRLPDNSNKFPDIKSKQVKDNLDIQQAFKDKKIITFEKMVQRKEKHVFSQVKLTAENTNQGSNKFSFFCRTMPIESQIQLSKCLERPDTEAVSDVYGYFVNQSRTDVTVEVPIYSTPDKFDDIFVEDSKGHQYTCQEIKQTKEGCFLVTRMAFEVYKENFMCFIALKKRKTDRHIVSGREQTMVASVEDKFVVCLPANCLPEHSSVELKVHPTDGFNNTLNTSSFCEIRTDHMLVDQSAGLQLPCSKQRSTDESCIASVYKSQDEGMTWSEVPSEVVDNGDAVKVLDKSYNATSIVTESTQKQTKHISSWIKQFLEWLYSEVITRKKYCSFRVMTKQIEDKFKMLVLLTDEKRSDDFLDKWKDEKYITQTSQKTSAYSCKSGQVFTVAIDKDPNVLLGSSSLDIRYQSGKVSHQEFIITDKVHDDIAVVYIKKRETKKLQSGNMASGILTQINVDLVKEISDPNPVVTDKFKEYPDDKFLSWLAGELGYEWTLVGVSIGLKYNYLESIEIVNDHRRTNLKMLYAWRKTIDHDTVFNAGVKNLISSLILVGRYDITAVIGKHVKELIDNASTERICKFVEIYQQTFKSCFTNLDQVEGASVNKDRIKDSYAVVSPFEDKFLLNIVIVVGFNIPILYQLGVPQGRIEHINHYVRDPEAAMFKCLIIAKRGYRDETTFYDDLLNSLQNDGNNQAISDITQQCTSWLKCGKRFLIEKSERLENVLKKYCGPK